MINQSQLEVSKRSVHVQIGKATTSSKLEIERGNVFIFLSIPIQLGNRLASMTLGVAHAYWTQSHGIHPDNSASPAAWDHWLRAKPSVYAGGGFLVEAALEATGLT